MYKKRPAAERANADIAVDDEDDVRSLTQPAKKRPQQLSKDASTTSRAALREFEGAHRPSLKIIEQQQKSKDQQLKSKDKQLQSQHKQLQSKDQQRQSKNQQLQRKDQQLIELNDKSRQLVEQKAEAVTWLAMVQHQNYAPMSAGSTRSLADDTSVHVL